VLVTSYTRIDGAESMFMSFDVNTKHRHGRVGINVIRCNDGTWRYTYVELKLPKRNRHHILYARGRPPSGISWDFYESRIPASQQRGRG